ncbi:hypothetical protein RB195_024454 [Necator americanus]|uniref:PID domain-containing protein n=1 Tax=Necator americanus TaxID=51031 RepID=A0ABR1EQG0_NECAM
MDQGATLRNFAKTVVNLSSGLLLARLPIPRSRNVGCVELFLSLVDLAGGWTSAVHRSSTPESPPRHYEATLELWRMIKRHEMFDEVDPKKKALSEDYMPVLNSSTSPSQFFTFPFRRKKQCYTINPPDLCYDVIYLGNVLTIMAGGEHCFEKPLALIWKAYCSRADADLSMGLEITRSGLKAKTKEQGLTEYWANRITSSGALPHYPKIFCWIYRHDGKRLKPDLRCHAVLCKRSSDAVTIHNKLQEFLHAALQKRSREVQDQPRLDMADLKADECRKKFRKRVSISTGLRTEKEVDDVKHGKHDKYWITS